MLQSIYSQNIKYIPRVSLDYGRRITMDICPQHIYQLHMKSRPLPLLSCCVIGLQLTTKAVSAGQIFIVPTKFKATGRSITPQQQPILNGQFAALTNKDFPKQSSSQKF